METSPSAARPPRRLPRPVIAALAGLLIALVVALGWFTWKVGRVRKALFSPMFGPEAATGRKEPPASTLRAPVVVAAHPEAAKAGAAILAAGGTAIDAAVAVQATLTLVEPQSSGLGGGAFILYHHGPSGATFAYDGRETAPLGARPSMFLDAAGQPLSFPEALVGGQSVGVPGVVHVLGRMHQRFGTRAWGTLFEPAITLAEQGFAVTPRLERMVALDPVLPSLERPRGIFFASSGWPLPVGSTLKNVALAGTLRQLATGGPSAFYVGPLATSIAEAVAQARRPSMIESAATRVLRAEGLELALGPSEDAAGPLTAQDLASYQSLERLSACAPYRGYRLCTVPPPAGGVSVLQVLKLLERFDLASLGAGSPEVMHLLVEAEALAEADRQQWVADPAFVKVPTAGLLDEHYLAERGKGLSASASLGAVTAGTPPGGELTAGPGTAFELPSTTHFVVADAFGSVASVTSSIEFGFGSHVLVGGFFLNNQLTDFSFAPTSQGKPVANAVAPGKRPRSAMAPFIVYDASGKPRFALGSPGGSRIVPFVAQALVALIDHRLSPQAAASQPHVLFARGKAEVEDEGWASVEAREAMVKALAAKGREVTVAAETSGLHVLELLEDGSVRVGVDPRREGAAASP